MAGAARPHGWERRPSASCWGSRPEMAGDMAPVRPLVPNQRRSVRRGPTLRLRPCGNGAAPGWELWPWPRCAPCRPAGGAHRGPAGTMGPAWTIASASRRAGQKPMPAAGSVGGRKYHRHAGLAAAGVGARTRRPPPSMGPPRRRPLQLVRRPSSAASSPKIRCCPCDPACLHPPDACTREVQFLENCQSGCTRHRWPCPEHHCRPRSGSRSAPTCILSLLFLEYHVRNILSDGHKEMQKSFDDGSMGGYTIAFGIKKI